MSVDTTDGVYKIRRRDFLKADFDETVLQDYYPDYYENIKDNETYHQLFAMIHDDMNRHLLDSIGVREMILDWLELHYDEMLYRLSVRIL